MTGEKIKLIRLSLGLNQTEFAKEINVSKNSISSWENNAIKPQPRQIKKILEFCKKNNIEA